MTIDEARGRSRWSWVSLAAAAAAAALAACDGRHLIGTVADDGGTVADDGGTPDGRGEANPAADSGPPSPGTVIGLAIDDTYSCAILAGGQVLCWGDVAPHDFASSQIETTPVAIDWLQGSRQIAASSAGGGCSARSDGSVLCWGRNGSGELGQGDRGSGIGGPVVVPGLAAVQVAAGWVTEEQAGYRCALRADGSVACWGTNWRGQCGDPSIPDALLAPTPVPGMTDVVQIAGGSRHTCALRRDGSVWCWGDNNFGQLGPSNQTVQVAGPTRVDLPGPATRVAVNTSTSCARVSGQSGIELWCWGTWHPSTNVLFSVSPYPSAPPTHVATSKDLRDIVMVDGRLCAVMKTFESDYPSGIACADASEAATNSGVADIYLHGLSGGTWTAIALSSVTSCALDVAGTVWCWGDNSQGQIGTGVAGDTWPKPTPVSWISWGLPAPVPPFVGADPQCDTVWLSGPGDQCPCLMNDLLNQTTTSCANVGQICDYWKGPVCKCKVPPDGGAPLWSCELKIP